MARIRHYGQSQPLQLIAEGPLISVVLVPHRAASTHGSFPPVGPIKLMVDTGATHTWVDQNIISKLGVPPIRFGKSIGIGGTSIQRPVYRLGVAIDMTDQAWKPGRPAPPGVGNITFSADIWAQTFPAGHKGPFWGLLGRDFLSHFTFEYSGKTGVYFLSADAPPSKLPGSKSSPGAAKPGEPGKAKRKRQQSRKSKRKSRK